MVQIGIFIVLLLLGYGFGRWTEYRHYQQLLIRERDSLPLPVTNLKTPPHGNFHKAYLVSGNVVVSVDYFKRILAALRNVFGGRVVSYETLLDRARREAILRMKEQAVQSGADMIYNIRVETASISKTSSRRDSVGAVEILAYGTALVESK